MAWWGWLIIAAIGVVSVVLIVWSFSRRDLAALIAKKEMAEAAAKTAAKKLEAERATREKLEAEGRALIAKMREIDAWYQDALVVLTKEKRDAFEALSTDPDALDRKLDELLGTERDTDPG